MASIGSLQKEIFVDLNLLIKKIMWKFIKDIKYRANKLSEIK